ncbi:hypothetical protein ABZT00_39080, partial [Streptomyces sp. NPDC005486]
MNPLKRLGCRRASILGLLAATVLATPGTATGAPDAVRASTLGAQAVSGVPDSATRSYIAASAGSKWAAPPPVLKK